MKVKSESEVAQSCSTLSDPMDCSLPGSSVHGISQARVLTLLLMLARQDFSSVQSLSRVRLVVTPWTAAHQAPPSMGFSRQEYWSGVPFLTLLDLKPLKFEALLEAYLSFLPCPSPKCFLKHLSISTATTFSCLCDHKGQKPGLPVLFFIHFNSLSTKRPETSFYSINQITWTPDYTSLWLPNTVSTKHKLCVPQSPPCCEPACFFKSHHSSP